MHDDPIAAMIASPHAALISSLIGFRARRVAAEAKLAHLLADAPEIEAKLREGDPAASPMWAANQTLIKATRGEHELVARAEQKTRNELAACGIAV